ncbi:MAG: hypothetical protein ACREQ5_28530, partial [Candidatus Dormibacteria bacterium]
AAAWPFPLAAASAGGHPAPASGPRIFALAASRAVVHNGQSVAWQAHTSPDVVGVVAKVALYSLPFTREGIGRFDLRVAIPSSVPWFFHRRYTLEVIARSADGRTVSRTTSIDFE